MGYMTVPAGTFTVNAGQRMDRGHATFSCPAGGANCMITVMADGTVTSAGGRATAMPSQMAQDAKMAADKKTDDLIKGVQAALVRPHTWGPFGVGQAHPSNVVVTPEVWDTSWTFLQGIAIGRDNTILHRATNPTINASRKPRGDTLNQDDTGVADNIEFMNQNMNTTLGQFAGEVHERTTKAGNRTTTDKLQIYHDKQASGPVKWSEYYSSGSRVENRVPSTSGIFSTSEATNVVANRNGRLGVTRVDYASGANGRLTLDSGAALSAAATALFAAPNDNFPSVNNQTFNYTGNTGEKPRRFPGTFHGVAGEYNCTGTCRIAKGNDGNFDLDGTWTFTPTANPNEILLPGLDHDTDYLVFGYWVKTVAQPGQDPTSTIGAIYEGSKEFGVNSTHRVPPLADPRDPSRGPPLQYFGHRNTAIAALRGKATYKGSAAGKYGLRVLNQDGSVMRSSAGSFTAKTTLTAQFRDDTNNVPMNDQLSIKGTITEFTDPQNPGNDLSAWSVELQRTKFGYVTGSSVHAGEEANFFPYGERAGALGGGGTTGMTGTTPSPNRVNAIWNGQFYGKQGSGNAAASTYPTGVTGAFKANFINGQAFGAFGAKLQE